MPKDFLAHVKDSISVHVRIRPVFGIIPCEGEMCEVQLDRKWSISGILEV